MINIFFERNAAATYKIAFPYETSICLELELDIGSIANCKSALDKRKNTLYQLFRANHFYPMPEWEFSEFWEKNLTSLERIVQLPVSAEPVCIWWSGVPRELCGLYCTLSLLGRREAPIYGVAVSGLYNFNDSVLMIRHCGDVLPAHWSAIADRKITFRQNFRDFARCKWESLCKEDAPLRIVMNGEIVSAPETFYDSFFLKYLSQEPQDIGIIIEKALGLINGVGDAFIYSRFLELEKRRIIELRASSNRLFGSLI